jgi:hypothetical protein
VTANLPDLVAGTSAWEAAAPVLLNTWKHHAPALRQRIRETVQAGAPALDRLASRLVVMGTELMDLYTGRFTPAEIGEKVCAALAAEGRLALPAYRAWLAASGGYGVVTFAEDDSRWVLRLGDEADRYLHVHPARWAPATYRVRANVLKTAVLVLAHVGIHGGDPLARDVVNLVRGRYLGLAPVGRDLAGDQGLGKILTVLRGA